MSTQKRKFELFARLSDMGFTYEEAVALRRIEMTLHRWAERECGDGSNWAIERDETTNRPYNVYHGEGKSHRYPIADREAGALKRLAAIVKARNEREQGHAMANRLPDVAWLLPFHQTDPRGCSLYLVPQTALQAPENLIVRKAQGLGYSFAIHTPSRPGPGGAAKYQSTQLPGRTFDTPEEGARSFLRQKGEAIPSRDYTIDQVYTRGVAVAA